MYLRCLKITLRSSVPAVLRTCTLPVSNIRVCFSFRSGAGRRVPGPGHENRRRWIAAGHAGRNQPQIHAQPGKRPVRWHRNCLHPTNRHEDKKQKKNTYNDFMSSSCPPLRSSPLFASFPFIPSRLPLLSSMIKRKSSR